MAIDVVEQVFRDKTLHAEVYVPPRSVAYHVFKLNNHTEFVSDAMSFDDACQVIYYHLEMNHRWTHAIYRGWRTTRYDITSLVPCPPLLLKTL